MEKIICQSCSMPLFNEEDKGTNADETKSGKYCRHCLQHGEFIGYQTLEEAINDSVNYAEIAGITKEEMLEQSKALLPTLERWKN